MYLGSKNTRLGIPDANINQLPTQYLSMGSALLTKVPNPYFGQIPASSSLGAATIAQQLLLRPYPRFTNVALFRDNVGNSKYNAVAAKLEKRLSHGLTLTASYTFSKLLDDASTVFSQTIFTGPVLGTTGSRRRLQPAPGKGRFDGRHSPGFRDWLGLRHPAALEDLRVADRGTGPRAGGRRRALSCRLPTTTPASASRFSGRIESATPMTLPAAQSPSTLIPRPLPPRRNS